MKLCLRPLLIAGSCTRWGPRLTLIQSTNTHTHTKTHAHTIDSEEQYRLSNKRHEYTSLQMRKSVWALCTCIYIYIYVCVCMCFGAASCVATHCTESVTGAPTEQQGRPATISSGKGRNLPSRVPRQSTDRTLMLNCVFLCVCVYVCL